MVLSLWRPGSDHVQFYVGFICGVALHKGHDFMPPFIMDMYFCCEIVQWPKCNHIEVPWGKSSIYN